MRGGFNDPRKTLLVPISFGVSSISLLHILDQQLQGRRDHGHHAGYQLRVLFVDQSSVLDQRLLKESRELLMQRYPMHGYTTISLEDCIDYGISDDLSQLDERRHLKDSVDSLPSATSKTDFIDITRRRLITAFAKKHRCDGILFGDTTTRLAERTLSETAKGRGITLPWLTSDGSYSGLNCVYPLRDLLRKELVAYARTVSPPLTSLISNPSLQVSTSSKDMTIDSLMIQYFESVEQNYPSIVANVVRTSNKLNSPTMREEIKPCSLCHYPMVNEAWGGDQAGIVNVQPEDATTSGDSNSLCYGCTRTTSKT